MLRCVDVWIEDVGEARADIGVQYKEVCAVNAASVLGIYCAISVHFRRPGIGLGAVYGAGRDETARREC